MCGKEVRIITICARAGNETDPTSLVEVMVLEGASRPLTSDSS